MSFCFIYNPSTNRSRSNFKFEKLKEMTAGWPDKKYKISDSGEHLKFLAKEAAHNYEVVVACGGDGTVRDVAVSIMNSGAKLGIIPFGSGNDFSKSIGISSVLAKSLSVLERNDSRYIAVGKCNDFYFINTLGFGFDGQTNYYANESSIGVGSVRYALGALKTNLKRTPFKVQVKLDNKPLKERDLIMITAANGRVEGGNFIIAPEATPFDGHLRLITIAPVSKWILPVLLPLFLVGKQQWLSIYECAKAEKISLSFNRPVFIHSDGEQIFSKESKFNISIMPSAIPVVC